MSQSMQGLESHPDDIIFGKRIWGIFRQLQWCLIPSPERFRVWHGSQRISVFHIIQIQPMAIKTHEGSHADTSFLCYITDIETAFWGGRRDMLTLQRFRQRNQALNTNDSLSNLLNWVILRNHSPCKRFWCYAVRETSIGEEFCPGPPMLTESVTLPSRGHCGKV